jgi:hypothetical protein
MGACKSDSQELALVVFSLCACDWILVSGRARLYVVSAKLRMEFDLAYWPLALLFLNADALFPKRQI